MNGNETRSRSLSSAANSNASYPDWKRGRRKRNGSGATGWSRPWEGRAATSVIGKSPNANWSRPRAAMVGGVALERAGRELERTQERHARAERELDDHRLETGYRRGLEWAFHALGDLNREKRLSIQERQAALELDAARGRYRETRALAGRAGAAASDWRTSTGAAPARPAAAARPATGTRRAGPGARNASRTGPLSRTGTRTQARRPQPRSP